MNSLAIVIPAFKSKFFQQTLESICNQSCKDFTLYIGDDASPDEIKSLVDINCNHIQYIYKRFEDNLGSTNMVAHWERCIDMTRNEEWIWFFSDDDIMSSDCVERFYKTLSKFKMVTISDKIFRFNLSVTDADMNLLKKYETPSEFSVEYFLENYFITHTLRNKAIEFIFSKKTFNEKGQFVNFPLAWGSDTATMLKFGQSSGFVTIGKGDVFWRASVFNISSNSNKGIDNQKPEAARLFLLWIIDFVRIYKGSRFHNRLIYHILYFFPKLPSLKNVKKIYNETDILFYRIIVWIVFIKTKRMLRVNKIKEIFKTSSFTSK